MRAGDQPGKKTVHNKTTLLDGATDWKLLDFDSKRIVYPPEITATAERPGIVIWSKQLKKVLTIELTCPAEEGIEAAITRKETRYFPLRCDAKDRGLNALVQTIEIGARGFIARSTPCVLKCLGQSPKQISADLKNMLTLIARCTYAIYLAGESPNWDAHRELLTMEDASTATPKPGDPDPGC